MNASSSFRHTLAARILTLIAGALPAAAGCTIGGSSCPDHIDPVTGELCFTPEAADAGADAGPATDPPVCPPREEAAAPLESATFQAVSEVLGGPTVKNGQCCYQAVLLDAAP